MSETFPGRGGLAEADARLLEWLGRIVEVVDPVPDDVREAGRALFAFRDPDAELMEAVALDTGVDAGRLEAVRGTAPTSRMHFFEFGDLSIDLELTTSGSFCSIVGLVADPAGSAGSTVTLESVSASFTSAPDDDGRFEARQVPVGLLRLRLERDGRPPLTTPWFDAG